MTTTTVETRHQQVGNWLKVHGEVRGDDFAVPEGWTLPARVRLCRTLVKLRGIAMGYGWYLTSDGPSAGRGEVDMISFVDDLYNDECLKVAHAFLAHHGYKVKDEYAGLYAK